MRIQISVTVSSIKLTISKMMRNFTRLGLAPYETNQKTQSLEFTTMRRVIAPALLALAFVAFSSVDASAGHLFGKLFGDSSCDACCDAEPACGCEAPACGCAEPACGCEVPACDSGCDSGCKPVRGLLSKLFHKHSACDMGCEPACGCEVVAPACGCAEPACGCEAPACGCDSGCAKPVRGLLHKLFHHSKCGCDSGCAVEPACGCEPSCGCGF